MLLSNYFNSLKHEVFTEMNERLYNETLSINEELINESPEEVIYEVPEVKEEVINHELETTTTTKKVIKTEKALKEDYYIGYITIPSIDFKRGFTKIDSKYNNVNRNLYVHPSSNYPDKENGNMIVLSHSGTSSISYFKHLYKLGIEDDVYVSYNNVDYHYRVKKIYEEPKNGKIAIKRNKNKKTITLITCTKDNKETQTVYVCELV